MTISYLKSVKSFHGLFLTSFVHLDALLSNLLQINFESASFVYGRLKLRNFGITLYLTVT